VPVSAIHDFLRDTMVYETFTPAPCVKNSDTNAAMTRPFDPVTARLGQSGLCGGPYCAVKRPFYKPDVSKDATR